jgi:hypothetical protein
MKARLLILICLFNSFLFAQPTEWFNIQIIAKVYDNGQPINAIQAQNTYNCFHRSVYDTTTLLFDSIRATSPSFSITRPCPKQTIWIVPNKMKLEPIVHDYMLFDISQVNNMKVFLDSINFQTGLFKIVPTNDTATYKWKGKNFIKCKLEKVKIWQTSSNWTVVDTLIVFDKETSYEIYSQGGKTIAQGLGKTVDISILSIERVYYLKTDTEVKGIIRRAYYYSKDKKN